MVVFIIHELNYEDSIEVPTANAAKVREDFLDDVRPRHILSGLSAKRAGDVSPLMLRLRTIREMPPGSPVFVLLPLTKNHAFNWSSTRLARASRPARGSGPVSRPTPRSSPGHQEPYAVHVRNIASGSSFGMLLGSFPIVAPRQ